ncbi:MAG TPA: kinase, partial [Candidatus Handelsmanbacteria bacterium]|nr:kinase [Candidatus Handelsmanbacteria bacterium]
MLGVMDLTIPEGLARNCSSQPSRRDWLARLPALVAELQARWSLTLGAPYEAGAAWVAPVTNRPAVLKLGMPHMEADQEIAGMQFWDGEPTARLLDLDVDYNALLLEQCDPGTPLGELPEAEQDVIMAGLLRRLWRVPAEPHPFRPLSLMTQHWSEEARQKRDNWVDVELLAEGLRLFEELPRTAPEQVLLATDLHAGNVLQAQRQPWLVIDPKPFVGDPAYDATQHLFNCRPRLQAQP